MKTLGTKTLKALVIVGALMSSSAVMASDGATLYKKCAGCHGVSGEKKALGKSQVIQGWEAAKVADALKGYKAGTYGGAMKALMKGQVTAMSDADIEAVSAYIATLK